MAGHTSAIHPRKCRGERKSLPFSRAILLQATVSALYRTRIRWANYAWKRKTHPISYLVVCTTTTHLTAPEYLISVSILLSSDLEISVESNTSGVSAYPTIKKVKDSTSCRIRCKTSRIGLCSAIDCHEPFRPEYLKNKYIHRILWQNTTKCLLKLTEGD